MMKKTALRFAFCLLCLALLLASSLLSVGATKPQSRYVAVEWELSEDLSTLTGNGVRYRLYDAHAPYYLDASRVFVFMNDVMLDGEACGVYGDSAYPHIVTVDVDLESCLFYVDLTGEAILDALISGSERIYYLEAGGGFYVELKGSAVAELDAEYEQASLAQIDVTSLRDAEIFEITAHDRTETVALQHGAVYQMQNGNCYYVCFEGLDNRYFNADGYFSYRSGNVGAYLLDSEWRSKIQGAIDEMTEKEQTAIYEFSVINGYTDINGNVISTSDYDDPDYRRTAIALFYVAAAVVGVLLPAGLLLLGLLSANTKKAGSHKHWYALVAAAGLWILAALLCMLLLAL